MVVSDGGCNSSSQQALHRLITYIQSISTMDVIVKAQALAIIGHAQLCFSNGCIGISSIAVIVGPQFRAMCGMQ